MGRGRELIATMQHPTSDHHVQPMTVSRINSPLHVPSLLRLQFVDLLRCDSLMIMSLSSTGLNLSNEKWLNSQSF